MPPAGLRSRDIVDAAVPVDLRRGDDLVGDRAGLVVGRVGVVAAGMGSTARLASRLSSRLRMSGLGATSRWPQLMVAMIMSGACVALARR